MRRRFSYTGRTALAIVSALGLAGCGLASGSPVATDVKPGSIGRGQPLKGANLTVTSKEFTEQIILGQIMALAFKAAGAEVLDRTAIQGSIGTREAVKSGAADANYEYTGTAWITYLGHTKPIPDPHEQWVAVRDEDRKQGLTWLPPAPMDNTYAFAANQKNAAKYKLETLSDVAALAKKNPSAVTLCLDGEFALREDGLPGLEKKYGFKIPSQNLKKMDSGIVYSEVSSGRSCTLGEVFTTDGRIPEQNLKVLKDDRKFFPNYNAAPVINSKTYRKYPVMKEILDPISKKLTTPVAQQLNAKVDVDGQDPHEVAKDWMIKEGFIKEG